MFRLYKVNGKISTNMIVKLAALERTVRSCFIEGALLCTCVLIDTACIIINYILCIGFSVETYLK